MNRRSFLTNIVLPSSVVLPITNVMGDTANDTLQSDDPNVDIQVSPKGLIDPAGFISITSDDSASLIAYMMRVAKKHPKMEIVTLITPHDTYDIDPMTCLKLDKPKNYPRYGCLIKTNEQ